MKKLLASIFIIIICSYAFTVNKTFQSIDDLAYVIALGIDTSDSNNLKVSFQIAIPSQAEGSSSVGSSSSSSSESYTISTVDASSISSARSLVNNYLSKEINLSHCKVVVISEEFAVKGIADVVYTLTNDIEMRPDTNLMISSCDAKNILENSTPFLESLPSKYYEVIPSSSKYTGYSPDTAIGDFLSSLSQSFGEPYAILCDVNTGKSSSDSDYSNKQNSTIEKDTNMKSSTSEIESDKSGILVTGTAVFHDDKLVGELTAIETLCHLIVTNHLQDCIITIPNPFSEDSTMDLYVTLNSNTKNTVELINGSPYVHSNVSLKAHILSSNENSDYTSEGNLVTIENYVNSYMQSQISSYFYKTAKEYKSDIAGIGKKVVGKFLTWEEWEDYNWLSNYENSFFDINVQTNVKSGYLLLKS